MKPMILYRSYIRFLEDPFAADAILDESDGSGVEVLVCGSVYIFGKKVTESTHESACKNYGDEESHQAIIAHSIHIHKVI
jgi:hypothetical protein